MPTGWINPYALELLARNGMAAERQLRWIGKES
jgi:hypothetical protein